MSFVNAHFVAYITDLGYSRLIAAGSFSLIYWAPSCWVISPIGTVGGHSSASPTPCVVSASCWCFFPWGFPSSEYPLWGWGLS